MDEDKEQPPQCNPDEEEFKQQELFSTSVESSEFVVSGPGANISVNKASHQDFVAIFEYAYQKGQDTATEQFHKGSWKRDLEENLRSKKEQKDAEDTETTAAPGREVQQLETLDDVADWYESLPDTYTQCLVQTMAYLHGAQAMDIARLMKTLHTPMAPEQANPAGAPVQSARPLSDRELYRHARIERRRINGVLRLFWKDLDSAGQQRFTMLVLHYLAEETVFFAGPDLADTLRGWAENEPNDCAWRAARALGVILFWRSSTEALWRLANQWANGTRMRDWRNAASLLSGAYNVEWSEDEKRASNSRLSDVLRLLNQWVERSQKAAGWRVGCAAAETYDLLDQRNPDIALDGLEKLLRLPGSGVSNDWESISTRLFTACVSNYVSIAWSNHIRNVLERLAHHARVLVYQQQRPEQIDDDLRYQGQCELHLDAILTIFFLVAVFSFEYDHSRANYSLIEPLPVQPELPDDQGRDILLAGILSTPEEQWREAILVLLCAAFFAQKEEQALAVMRQWADSIEAMTQSDATKRQQMQTVYHRFIVELYALIEVWEADPQRIGFGPMPASVTFKYYLHSWMEKADWNGTTNSAFLRTFTQKILTQLEG